MRVQIRPGTDIRYPSYRIKLLGLRTGAERDKKGDPQIALVFRKGETKKKIRQAIEAAVRDYKLPSASSPQADPTILAITDVQP